MRLYNISLPELDATKPFQILGQQVPVFFKLGYTEKNNDLTETDLNDWISAELGKAQGLAISNSIQNLAQSTF